MSRKNFCNSILIQKIVLKKKLTIYKNSLLFCLKLIRQTKHNDPDTHSHMHAWSERNEEQIEQNEEKKRENEKIESVLCSFDMSFKKSWINDPSIELEERHMNSFYFIFSSFSVWKRISFSFISRSRQNCLYDIAKTPIKNFFSISFLSVHVKCLQVGALEVKE